MNKIKKEKSEKEEGELNDIYSFSGIFKEINSIFHKIKKKKLEL